MSGTNEKKSISEQINEILKPKELIEETDEDETRFEKFTEHDTFSQLSDIRRQNAKSLSELDSKYEGKAVSRKELELEDESREDDSIKGRKGRHYSTESDSSEESLYKGERDVEENSNDSSEEDFENENSSEGSDENDLGDDVDLSQFFKSHSKTPISRALNVGHEKTEFLKDKSLSEEIQKGVCVQNQLKLWEKLLEVRIKSQKMLITANSLPDYDAHLELSTMENSTFHERIEKTCDSLHGLLENLLELQSTLVTSFPESKDVFTNAKRKKDEEDSNNGFIKRSKVAQYSDRIEDNYEDYKSFRNEVLQKWHERTRTAKDMKNPMVNMNITTKIENSLLGKSELIKKSQLYRGDYNIYGVDKSTTSVDRISEKPIELYLPEIFDDSEFYHQLLRELIEYKSNTDENQSEITQKFIELQKVRSKMKKKVDTRASKGRRIRYIVHNKLVNYMPPRDNGNWTDEAKTELYSSLFGMANQGEKL